MKKWVRVLLCVALAVLLVVGGLLVLAYTKTIAKKGSLDKE